MAITGKPKLTVVLGGRRTYLHGQADYVDGLLTCATVDLTRAEEALKPPGEHNLDASTVMPAEPDVRLEFEDIDAVEALRDLCNSMLRTSHLRARHALELNTVVQKLKDAVYDIRVESGESPGFPWKKE